jgi:hypothetical protein
MIDLKRKWEGDMPDTPHLISGKYALLHGFLVCPYYDISDGKANAKGYSKLITGGLNRSMGGGVSRIPPPHEGGGVSAN